MSNPALVFASQLCRCVCACVYPGGDSSFLWWCRWFLWITSHWPGWHLIWHSLMPRWRMITAIICRNSVFAHNSVTSPFSSRRSCSKKVFYIRINNTVRRFLLTRFPYCVIGFHVDNNTPLSVPAEADVLGCFCTLLQSALTKTERVGNWIPGIFLFTSVRQRAGDKVPAVLWHHPCTPVGRSR